MQLPFLKQEAIDDFSLNFEMYKDHYQDSDNSWFVQHWDSDLQLSDIEIDDIDFDYGSDPTKTDKANVVAIHSALRNLPRSVAADERVWAALAHTTGWDFLHHRRKGEIEKGNTDRLKSIFFFASGKRRSCYMHGLAKYWWTGTLTYDAENKADPYEALDTLCALPYFTSLVFFLFSSNCTANKNVLLGLIDSFSSLRRQNIPFREDHWKELLGYLNKLGSSIVLDALSKADVRDICLRQLGKMIGF